MKIAICNELFKGWDLQYVFEYVSGLGYDGVEIAPFTISDDVRKIGSNERREINDSASSYGLKVIGTHWLLATPKGLHLTHPNESVRQMTKRYLCELVKFTTDIGGRILVFGSPDQRKVLTGVSHEDAWNYAKDIFHDCSRLAKDYGAIFALEPLAKHLTDFINTAEEAIQLIKEVSHPNFKLHLDVFSMLDEGRPLPEIIERSKDYLVHFHANDDNRLGPGFGRVDYRPIIKALEEIGYKGFLSVEVFDFSLGPERTASGSLQNLKKLLQSKEH